MEVPNKKIRKSAHRALSPFHRKEVEKKKEFGVKKNKRHISFVES